ncbi:MAG: amidohydrolase family protein [FCB group bacterium]|nr:amidohydrolase family protein [FCB group bacterium]
MKRITAIFFILAAVWTQTAPELGLRDRTPRVYAITNARVIPEPGVVWEAGTIVIRDGRIENAGENISIPEDARVLDGTGKTVYAGFIDLDVETEIPEREVESVSRNWNPGVHPEYVSGDTPFDKKTLKALRELGFTTALSVPNKGIFRGSSRLLNLADSAPENALDAEAVQWVTFEYGHDDKGYPGSLLGSIALFRQTLYDADWYTNARSIFEQYPENNRRPEIDDALEILADHLSWGFPFCFNTTNETDELEMIKLAREFSLNLWLRGSGYEYQRAGEIEAANFFLILPLNFPEAPLVDTPEQALEVSLADLRHWDLAPENPRILQEHNIRFALTSSVLKERKDFRENLIKAVELGLTKENALAALTTTPARELNVDQLLGSIKKGKLANLVVCSGDYFDRDSEILSLWIEGRELKINEMPEADIRGDWTAILKDSTRYTIRFKGKISTPRGSILKDTLSVDLEGVSYQQDRLAFRFEGSSFALPEGYYRFSGTVSDNVIAGTLTDPSGIGWPVSLNFVKNDEEQEQDTEEPVTQSELTVRYPEGAYGLTELPEQFDALLIRNGTLWTCEPDGILENTDMLIEGGKIKKIGRNLRAPRGAKVIDAAGKQITPGLIDCHAHLAERSVNEGSVAISSEVRIKDVLNPDDINIYRQLAGGTTVSHTLHGSANPIGGQDGVIKLRWGSSAEGLFMQEAPPGIKFALGENVKQSNWGDDFTTRYPQTRMGVDQIIRDAFNAALEYEQKWDRYVALGSTARKKTIPPRKDLELQALVEVLRGKRMVHCHAYRQDEMLNLIRIADEYGIQLATFDHGLEAYKLADAIAGHGMGVTTFSDWWAYKFEVYDAIPYNGNLLHDAGVVVSFNSDDGELGRRLNYEAGKALKYGDISPEEALKFVTLNPAKQLKIDSWVGSLKPGKDADFVIWSGDPLSASTRCEQTWIDGKKYFDIEEDLVLHERDVAEHNILVQKVLAQEQQGRNREEGGSR